MKERATVEQGSPYGRARWKQAVERGWSDLGPSAPRGRVMVLIPSSKPSLLPPSMFLPMQNGHFRVNLLKVQEIRRRA